MAITFTGSFFALREMKRQEVVEFFVVVRTRFPAILSVETFI